MCQITWEARISACGRLYYIDHNTQTTTWQCPSSSNLHTSLQNINSRPPRVVRFVQRVVNNVLPPKICNVSYSLYIRNKER
ncbi:hypothetical protein MXB_1915 [Myxobolus squamalis]|nr:hypothetical protein MXB_1915 [Myxobolus squamalis]